MSACGTWVFEVSAFRGGSFWGILAGIYLSFGENHGKLRTTRSTTALGNRTRQLPSTSFERRSAQPLIGLIFTGELQCIEYYFSFFVLKKTDVFKRSFEIYFARNENIFSGFVGVEKDTYLNRLWMELNFKFTAIHF